MYLESEYLREGDDVDFSVEIGSLIRTLGMLLLSFMLMVVGYVWGFRDS